MLPSLRWFIISIVFHVLMVIIVLALPVRQSDPMRLLKLLHHVEHIENYNNGVRPVVKFEAQLYNNELLTDAMDDTFDDSLPSYIENNVQLEPVMPNIVIKQDITSDEHESSDQEPTLQTPRNDPEIIQNIIDNNNPSDASIGGEEAHVTSSSDMPQAVFHNSSAQLTTGLTGSPNAASSQSHQSVNEGQHGNSQPSAIRGQNTINEDKLWKDYSKQLTELFAQKRVYPPMAKRLGHSGTVWIEIEIDRTGRLLSLKVVTSSGSSILDRAATELVKKTEIMPFPQGVSAQTKRIRIPFEYALKH